MYVPSDIKCNTCYRSWLICQWEIVHYVLFELAWPHAHYTNRKQGANQECATFGVGQIRITIVSSFADTNTSSRVQAVNNTNWIACYNVGQPSSRTSSIQCFVDLFWGSDKSQLSVIVSCDASLSLFEARRRYLSKINNIRQSYLDE
jgi:hypothetical protein